MFTLNVNHFPIIFLWHHTIIRYFKKAPSVTIDDFVYHVDAVTKKDQKWWIHVETAWKYKIHARRPHKASWKHFWQPKYKYIFFLFSSTPTLIITPCNECAWEGMWFSFRITDVYQLALTFLLWLELRF